MDSVLFVCTANVCRSPMAEALLRRRFADSGEVWTVSSAGTEAESGRPTHPLAINALAALDVEAEPIASQPLTNDLIDDAGLILTATRAHLRQIALRRPDVIGKTFVLRQFARVLSSASPDQVARTPDGLIEIFLDARALLQPTDAAHVDLVDPIGGRLADFVTCARTIDAAVDQLSAHIAPLATQPA